MVQLALVGGSHIHTPNFARILSETAGVETRYVWDPDRSVAEARQAVTGGEIVDEAGAVFDDPDVAGVVICSQTDLHERLVLAAAKAGKHMFVEKPLGMGSADAQQMAEAIERAGVIFQTGYFMRGRAEVQAVRQLLTEGRLGRLTRIRLSNCHTGSLRGLFDDQWRWMADPERAGCGAFGDLGTHVLDLLLWLLADDVVDSCTGCIQTVTGRYGEACDESGEALLRFGSGTLASLAAGWVDHANPNFLEVSGLDGHARITGDALYVTSPALEADGSQPWTSLPEAWPHAFEIFLAHVRDGQAPQPCVTPREAALRNAVMEAIYRGAVERCWTQPAVTQ